MAQGVVIRFKADSTEYDAKLKRSIEQMKSMEDQAKKLQGSIDRTDEGYVKFVQSLGKMDTIAKSSKTALREYSEAILYLQQQYKALSDTEKSGDVGKAMAESIQQLKVRAAEAQDSIADLNLEIKNMASDTQIFDQIAGGVTGLVSVFQVGQGAMQMFGVKSNEAMQAMAKLQGAMAVANGLTKIQAALQKESNLMQGVAKVQRLAAAAAQEMETKAMTGNVAATKAATVAQKALNAVAKANPFLLLASAIGAVVGALAIFSGSASKAAQDQKKLAESVGTSMGKMVTSYNILKDEWQSLTTEQEKDDWIKNNADKFNELGVAIENVNDAEKVFNDGSIDMLKSFELRAKAAALQTLAEENYKEYYENYEKNKDKMVSAGGDVKYWTAHNNELALISSGYAEATGFLGMGGLKWTEEGAKWYNEQLTGKGEKLANAYLEEFEDVNKKYDDFLKENGLKKAEDTVRKDDAGQYDAQMKAEIAALDKVQMTKEGKEEEYEKKVYEIKKKWLQKTVELYAKGSSDRSRAEGNLSQLEIDYQNSQIRTGKSAATAQEKADKPKTQAQEKVDKALEDYATAMNIAAIRKEAGLDDEEKYKSTELAARERLLDAYAEAYNLYADPKYKEAFDKEAEEVLALAKVVKELKDAKEAQKQADRELEQAEKEKARQIKQNDSSILSGLTSVAKKAGWTTADLGITGIKKQIDADVDITEDTWKEFEDKLNERLKELHMDPIQINFETGSIETPVQAAKQTEDAWQNAVAAVNNVGSALQQLEDPAAKVSGIVMQAVANIALGFAQAAASPATGAAGVFGWIAAATAGVATMASTIAAIKSATSGSYASGGIIPGNSFSGDNLTANVNSGELILNRAQQGSIAGQLNSNPMGNMQLETRISGTDMLIFLNNTNRSLGGSRSFYSERH